MDNMYIKGDIIQGKSRSTKGIERIILKVIKDDKGITYLWGYPDLPKSEDNEFWSGNSGDPELTYHWKLKNSIN